MKRLLILTLGLIICFLFIPTGCLKKSTEGVDLSPASWPAGDLEEYTRLAHIHDQPHPLAEGCKGMVAGTQEALAVRCGLEALKQGGTAADAALAAALTQNALSAGSWVSYAGFMNMVYYEASTGKIYSMNAAWNTVQEEKDPLSIPFQNPLEKPRSETPSGRSALVPGFMAGVQAAHDRFGKLPFASLFEPSIYFAENGFEISSKLARYMKFREDVLTRLPDTRKIFTKANGGLYQEGDLFKQPELAETLRNVAAHGADYMYKGEWAKKCVEAIQREGGKMTLKDLSDYKVMWSEPLHSTYRNFDVYTLALPNYGGVNTIEALNLLELADLPQFGHYTTSPESLYWLIQITRVFNLIRLFENYFPDRDFSYESRLKKETAKFIWEKMQDKDWDLIKHGTYTPKDRSSSVKEGKKDRKMTTGHSEAIVAVDQWGNVATVLHTINTVFWGMTGIFVDGISIADSACFQQQLIKHVGPGARLPEGTNPFLVFKDGKPFLASSCIGSGLHEETLQEFINVLDFGMDPKTAADTPSFLLPAWTFSEPHKQVVVKGEFPEKILNSVSAMGQEFRIVPGEDRIRWQGCWVGIKIDPQTGKLQGGAPWQKNGLALGY